MKTEQQVKEWLKGKIFSKDDATEIRIHLIRAFGDWDKAWYVGEGGTNFTYSEFIEWFSNDICESCGQPLPKKWTPEYGDICWGKGKCNGEYVFIKGIKVGVFISDNSKEYYDTTAEEGVNISTIRPATSEEKQLLFYVLDKDGKVLYEKEKCLNDKPKWLKEEWEEYYRENNLDYFGLGDKKHGSKIVAIEQLLLCAKFINSKFEPDGELSWGIYISNKELIVLENRQELTEIYSISDIFTSKHSAYMAIDLLGEDTIRTALSSEY